MEIILSRELEGNSGQELAEEMGQGEIGCCVGLEYLHSLGVVLDPLFLIFWSLNPAFPRREL